MKRFPYILLILLISAVAITSQTPQKIEQDLLAKLKTLEGYSSYGGNSLNENVKIFQTRKGLTNSIGFAYNFFSVSERRERPIILILFDSQTNVLKIPVVIENKKYPNGEVTNRFINYKFNGTVFVNAK